MDYTNSNSGGGYMDTSFDGSSGNGGGYARVSFTISTKQLLLKTLP